MEHVTHDFQPVYDASSAVLILGSMPSVKSRETGFYYGHPQNRFWKLLAALIHVSVPHSVDEKIQFLHDYHIALWDVIASCDIIGSSDASIRNVTANDIAMLLQKTNITRIYANGATAGKLYKKHIYPTTGIEAIVLPSTSPANASCSFEQLKEIWMQIL